MSLFRPVKLSVVFAGFAWLTASLGHASTIEQLFFDAGGGTTATINVDNLGFVTCSGTCGGIIAPASITPHTTLQVTGTLGQFTLNATGVGGATAIAPTLQNLNQIEAASSGAGTLLTSFTDTDYFCPPTGCFGSTFIISVSTTNNTGIAASTTTFAAFADAGNGIPAGTLIGTFAPLTGLADADAGSFANLVGGTGSLTSTTSIHFTGKGAVQANMQISSVGPTTHTTTPEPSSLALFGMMTGCVVYKLRGRKV
jgi:hypothetical protein